MRKVTREQGMWETVQFAIADGWQATTRLCLFVLVRYGPWTGLGMATIQALEAVGRHHGL